MKNKFLTLAMLLMVSLTFVQWKIYNPNSEESTFEKFATNTLSDVSPDCSPIYENVQYHDDKTQALLDDEYRGSDLAWMDMKSNQSVVCCWCTTLHACIRCEDFFEQCL